MTIRCVKHVIVCVTIMSCLVRVRAWADMFDDARKQTFDDTYQYYQDDETGFNYRMGGSTYTPSSAGKPVLSGDVDAGLGCGDYDLAASFKNFLNTEMLADYVKSAGLEFAQALPWMILAETFPTWYDKIKDGMHHARQLQMFSYYRCEDYRNMGWDGIAQKIKNIGKSRAIAQGDTQNLSGSLSQDIACEKLSKPNGSAIGSGTLEIVRDTLEWAKLDKNDVLLAEDILGDITVRGANCSMVYKGPAKHINAVYRTNYETVKEKLVQAVQEYKNNGEVEKGLLKEISLPTLVITNTVIKSLYLLPEYKTQASIDLLASDLALVKTTYKLDELIDGLEKGRANPVYPEPVKDELVGLVNKLKTMKTEIVRNRTIEEIPANRIVGIMDESITEEESTGDYEIETMNDKYKKAVRGFGYGGMINEK